MTERVSEPGFRELLQRLFSLEGRAALVTGASGGIGRALALGLAGAGAVVGVHGTNLGRIDETCRLVEAAGGRAVPLAADLSDPHQPANLAQEAAEKLGRIDILVNNAGINRRRPLLQVSSEDMDAVLTVNLRSILLLSQAAHPFLKQNGGGKIINIGSMTSFLGLGNIGVYGMSKAALAQLTKTMAIEWAADNIQVNCLAPGFIVTPLTEEAIFGQEHIRRWLIDRIPARRGGTPEDLIGTAILLASAGSDYLTGQTLAVDGGFLAGGSWSQPE